MTTVEKPKSYTLEFEEKATPVLIYMQDSMAWGEVVTKELVRVSTWLRTPKAPNYICLYDSHLLYANSNVPPIAFKELNIPAGNVAAIHMIPPLHDPVDYDLNEPNRKLEPVTAMIGPFQLNGSVRMSTHANLRKFLELMTEKYSSLYEVEISQPMRPNIKPLRVPYVLIRREFTLFSTR